MAVLLKRLKPRFHVEILTSKRNVKADSTLNKYDSSAVNYCMNLVRQHDYENYLCCLLLKKQSRNAVFAVRGLNVELAKICDSTIVETIGQMKLKFWRDVIQNIFKKGTSPDHPVAKELQKAIETHNLSKHWFTRLLDSREENLHSNPFLDLADLEAYSEKSVSSVFYLTLESAGVRDTSTDHCASHLGKAVGIVTLLRSTLHHLRSRRVLWPADIMIKNGVSQEDILRGRNITGIKEVTFEIASRAHGHLDKVKSLSKNLPKAATRSLLPAVPCDSFLNTLRQVDFDIFHAKLHERNSLLPVLLLKALLKGFS